MNTIKEYEYVAMPAPLGQCLMNEKLLQFIWQFQYFNRTSLHAATGEKIEIVCPGKLNHNQGPDFTDAQIRIGGTLFAGSVEIHLKTSQWKEHGHHLDQHYRNVILHVVLENNEAGHPLPVLELGSLIPRVLLDRYDALMHSPSFIPCAGSVQLVKDLTWQAWKERLLAERLTRKAEIIFRFLHENKGNWEETFWWMLARNFGGPVNADAFEAIARSIPLNLVRRHKQQILHLEALLLGQAGLLNPIFKEDYPKLLQREYRFFLKKYALQPIHTPVLFLRMRPGNFPSIRLAQLAAFLQNVSGIFSGFFETEDLNLITEQLNVTANDYWHYHYMIDEVSAFRKKRVGKEMTDHIIINTVVPLLFAYGIQYKNEMFRTRALQWLEKTTAESNTIIQHFSKIGVECNRAFDSQALIELKTKYCDARRCLQCSIGNTLLKI